MGARQPETAGGAISPHAPREAPLKGTSTTRIALIVAVATAALVVMAVLFTTMANPSAIVSGRHYAVPDRPCVALLAGIDSGHRAAAASDVPKRLGADPACAFELAPPGGAEGWRIYVGYEAVAEPLGESSAIETAKYLWDQAVVDAMRPNAFFAAPAEEGGAASGVHRKAVEELGDAAYRVGYLQESAGGDTPDTAVSTVIVRQGNVVVTARSSIAGGGTGSGAAVAENLARQAVGLLDTAPPPEAEN